MHTPSQHAEAGAQLRLRTDQMNANREGAAGQKGSRISGSGEWSEPIASTAMSVSGTRETWVRSSEQYEP